MKGERRLYVQFFSHLSEECIYTVTTVLLVTVTINKKSKQHTAHTRQKMQRDSLYFGRSDREQKPIGVRNRFSCSPVHSSALFCFLLTLSIVSVLLTIDEYLIQPHLKKHPNYPFTIKLFDHTDPASKLTEPNTLDLLRP